MTTTTIDATDLRNNLSEALDSVAPGKSLIVRKRGKLVAALVDLDEYEDMLASADPNYIKSINEARTGKRYSMKEAFADVWDETK
jgi:prevent-host-death family protein